jgi:hypothetical protein
MALLFFMILLEGLGNAPLVTFVLNGQGHFMVRAPIILLFLSSLY